MSTAFIAAIQRDAPQETITICCPAYLRDIYVHIPNVEEIITIAPKLSLFSRLYLLFALSGVFWNRVIDLRATKITGLLWTRQRLIIKHITRAVLHNAMRRMYMKPHAPYFWASAADYQRAQSFLPARAYICFAPRGDDMWGAKEYAELAWRLAGDRKPFAGAPLVVLLDRKAGHIKDELLKRVPTGQFTFVYDEPYGVVMHIIMDAGLCIGQNDAYMALGATTQCPLFLPACADETIRQLITGKTIYYLDGDVERVSQKILDFARKKSKGKRRDI